MVATRASDADRDSCVEDIEAAYADGRLDGAEREARTQAALQATTVEELAELVSDLGPAARRRAGFAAAVSRGGAPGVLPTRFLRLLLVAILVLAVIAVVAWAASGGGDDDAASSGPASQQQAPEERLELHTAEGFERFVTLIRAKFGTTIVHSAAIYPDYASIEVVLKDDPRRVENWYFGKGFEGEPTKGSRPADSVAIDLASVDAQAYARAIKRAPSVLGVEDITSTYVVIRDSGDEPSFSVYVSNEYSENGYWTFSLQGEELRRYAFE